MKATTFIVAGQLWLALIVAPLVAWNLHTYATEQRLASLVAGVALFAMGALLFLKLRELERMT